ncbi:MAG: hypothetical protein ACK5N8_09230 [Alphaproteobacteria bacterium]
MQMQSKIEQLRTRSEDVREQAHHRIPNILHAKTRQDASSPQKIMADAVEREFNTVGENAKQQIARELVVMPHGRKVKIGGEVMNVEDLQYAIAESIDIYQAGTSRKYEYHEYISDATKIISDMNSNGVTPQELDSRNHFIDDTIQRENELLTCLALYKSSNFSGAQEKYRELYTKLQKIREVRSAVLSSTKSVADKFDDREDERDDKLEEDRRRRSLNKFEREIEKENTIYPTVAEKAVMAGMILALFSYEKLSDEKKQELGIYHGNLEKEISPEKALNWLINDVKGLSFMESKILEKHRDEHALAKHLLALSGVRNEKYGNQNVVERRYQEFDQNRFNDILLRRKLEEERLRA